ncbi:piggyBac transposable element-derived protein 4-like [Dermacentor albipictus]|uniref:piggyBac transposable element-derived protein 4-like n=1 Tax=Dermacentor albipictus TaxID=60249 RepID=UPI0038FC7310
MTSRRKTALTCEEILELVFQSDDEEATLDQESGDDETDGESSSGCESDLCVFEGTSLSSPPPSKKPRNEDWQWEEKDRSDNVSKLSFTGSPGVKQAIQLKVGDSPSALGLLNALLGDDFWDMIARHSNAYARQKQAFKPDPTWHETTPGEMKVFFALCVLMSQVRKSSIQAYWSQRSVICTPFFATVMPRCFWALSQYLPLYDSNLAASDDKLWKLRPVLDYIIKSIGSAYSPEEGLAMDESLMKFRGHLA